MPLPNFITRALAFFDKAESSLAAETLLAAANARIVALETELSEHASACASFLIQITTLTTEAVTAKAALEAKELELQTAAAALEAEKRKAVDVLAGQGISADLLPATVPNASPTGAQSDRVAKLRAQLEASNDPQEKFTISVQIRELLAKARK